MMLFRLLIVCFCGIVSLSYFAQCAAEEQGALKKDTSITEVAAAAATATTTPAAQSTIYKIKRLDAYDTSRKEQKRTKQQKQQMLQATVPAKTGAGASADAFAAAGMTTTPGGTNNNKNNSNSHNKSPRTKKVKNSAKNLRGQNKKLLNKLGFTKVKAPNSHNRKRLAIESRRHASADDSHMFIIKLPPNLYYYASPKASSSAAGSHSHSHSHGHGHGNSIGGDANPHNALAPPSSSPFEKEVLNANGKKVSFPFNSNGKPGRIYHWNLPAIKKILEDKQRFAGVATATKDQLIDIKDTPTWTRPWENETYQKSYGKSSNMLAPSAGTSSVAGGGGLRRSHAGDGHSGGGDGNGSYKKSLKRKSPSYYAPANAVNKSSFNKYFAGNGKPKGFYVIKENQKKPLYYRNIVS